MCIFLGSDNPSKTEAVKLAFSEISHLAQLDLKIIPKSVNSGVDRYPFDKDIYNGAKNRAYALQSLLQPGNFAIGIESGFFQEKESYFTKSTVFIIHKEFDNFKYSSASSLSVPISQTLFDSIKLRNSQDPTKPNMSLKKILYPEIISFLSDKNLTRINIEKDAIKSALLPLIYRQKYLLADHELNRY